MCRVYGHGDGRYVRLCYRKGVRQGEHIRVSDDFELHGRCYPTSAKHRRELSRRHCGSSLTFRVWCYGGLDDDITAMARYAHAEAWVDLSTHKVRLVTRRRWQNVEGIVARAKSYGWVMV